MNLLMKIQYLIFFILGENKKNMLNNILSTLNDDKFIPMKFLLKNALGEKIILCDKKAGPYTFNMGESIIEI
tara:strand:- start:278 stop:493 length:216 start_codon:yes stop_codon:yes gene_type:complete